MSYSDEIEMLWEAIARAGARGDVTGAAELREMMLKAQGGRLAR